MIKKRNNRYLLFGVLLTAFLFLDVSLASALEVDIGVGENPSIGEYVVYIFKGIAGAAIAISTVSFAVGAIGLMNPNVEAHNDAKDRMKGAVLGLILTLSSFAIISTINPQLKDLTLTELPESTGVFLASGSGESGKLIECPKQVADLSTMNDYTTIEYKCGDSSNQQKILVWNYPQKNLESGNQDLTQVKVETLSCGQTLAASQSFRWDYETEGIYFYLDEGCTQYASSANTASSDNLPSPFAEKMKAVKIINGFYDYGALFHSSSSLKEGGSCSSKPIVNEGCQKINMTGPHSVDVFLINNDDPSVSGDGVMFYSRPYGQDTGSKAGWYSDNVENVPVTLPARTKFEWEGVNATDEYQEQCETFQDCPGSILLKGKYLVALYSDGGSSSGYYCQTFTSDVYNLNAQPITKAGGKLIKILIYPTF